MRRQPLPFRRRPSAAFFRGGADVQAALLVFWRLPPPAAGADVFAGPDPAGAGGAADGPIALGVQRVDGEVVLARVAPDLRFRPGSERVQLEDAAVRRVDLRGRDICAGNRLLAAQPGDPRRFVRERAPERLELADGAAFLALLDAAAEGEEPLLALQRLHPGALGKVAGNFDAVAAPHLLHDLVRLGREPPRIQREDADAGRVARGEVDEHHVLHPEARGDGGALAESLVRPGKALFRGSVREPPWNRILCCHACLLRHKNEKARLPCGWRANGELSLRSPRLGGVERLAVPPRGHTRTRAAAARGCGEGGVGGGSKSHRTHRYRSAG